jgi:Mrp family chromosome partitioning ATPase
LCPTSKVLFIDLDLITPKADSWFNKMPMIRGIPGVSGTGLNDTGMGIFFNKGMSVVSGFLDNIIIKGCEVTKGGCIDYISGCYGKMEQTKIADADFTTLLSMLGAIYDYIIIDLGRIGASEVTDSLIKELSDISYRTIVVTTSDRFDTRNFKNKLLENKIKIDKLAWMLNMCESTTIEDKVKQYIGPINYGIMLNDSAMRGGREQFMKNKVNRDKLDLFLDTAVFCRK